MDFSISHFHHLDEQQVELVKQLNRSATVHDDLAPLSEHVLIHLNHGGDDHDEHVVAMSADSIVGYLHLDQTDQVAGPVVELVVHPAFRRNGVGTALVKAAVARVRDSRLRLWAHGELAMAHALAENLGFNKSRELWQMRRSLLAALPKLEIPEEVTIRHFAVGQDEEAWLKLNAAVFADHPEQGQLSASDLHVRMNESWFDPAGFLIAEKSGDMIGFHWTKIHGGHRHGSEHNHAEVGEIYVLGVTPAQRGTGLSQALTIAGLEYLRDQGLNAAMLYVDADNASAIRLYESVGFGHWDTDVMFSSSTN